MCFILLGLGVKGSYKKEAQFETSLDVKVQRLAGGKGSAGAIQQRAKEEKGGSAW